MTDISARDVECQYLGEVYQQNKAAFLAVYGRRRIGKTHLIKHYFQDKGTFFHLTGINKAKLDTQLNNFAIEFADVFNNGHLDSSPNTWFDAFNLLRRQIAANSNDGQKTIIFLDELPWLASARSGFLQALEHCWNRYLCDETDLILVVCGSAASWMIKNIIHAKGGLHARITHELHLKPFTLKQTQEFLVSKGMQLNQKQIVDLYMALGGVAHYLGLAKRGVSSEQIINEICFKSHGALYGEFENLFRSLFKNYKSHLKILRALASSKQELNYEQLAKASSIPSGGTFTHLLHELEMSGFIAGYQRKASAKTKKKYRIVDEYTNFYLTWCEKQQTQGLADDDEQYWQKQHNSTAWRAWSGFAFEAICLKHLSNIKNALGIASVITHSSGWSFAASEQQGAEIDLVIDRADQCINLCEIKYYGDVFTIDKNYAEILRRKKQVFIKQTKTKKAVFMTLITTYGAQENNYFHELVDSQLTLEQLFK